MEVSPADWETFIAVIAQNILEEQTPKRLLEIRCPGTCLPPPVNPPYLLPVFLPRPFSSLLLSLLPPAPALPRSLAASEHEG